MTEQMRHMREDCCRIMGILSRYRAQTAQEADSVPQETREDAVTHMLDTLRGKSGRA